MTAAPAVSSRKREALNISIEDFKSGMEKFAMMFTGNYGVQLVFRGTSAYTNGKIIVVPELSLLSRPNMTDAEIDEALEFLMCTRGFVYHEGAHIIFSGDITSIVRSAMRVSPKFKHLWNVIEDLRVENSIANLYPGAREALVFMNDWLQTSIAKKLEAAGGTLSPFAATCYAIGLIGTLSGRGEDHQLWSMLNEQTREYVTSIRKLVMRARNAQSPKVAYKIALEIWNHLKDEEERRKQEKKRQRDEEKAKAGKKTKKEKSDGKSKRKPKKPKASSKDDEGEDDDASGGAPLDEDDTDQDDASDGGDDDDAGDDSSGDEEGAEGDGDDDESADDEGDDDGDGDDHGDGGRGDDDGDDAATEEAPEPDPALDADEQLVGDEADESDKAEEKEETIRERMKNEVKQTLAVGERRYRVYTTEHDVIGPPPKPPSDDDLQRYRQFVNRLDEETRFAYGPVKRQLENLLKAQTHSFYIHGLDAGELDPAALHRLASAANGGPQMKAQAQYVFREKVRAKSLKSTDVEIVIDVSGSMGCAGKDVSLWHCQQCDTEAEHLVVPPSIDYYHFSAAHRLELPKTHTHECPSCGVMTLHKLVKAPEWEAKISLARKCALVFAHSLESVHVPFDMYTYTTEDPGMSERVLEEIRDRSVDEYNEVRQLYSRFGGLHIMDIKRFDERWANVMWRLAHVNAAMCNYDGESLRIGAQRLMARRSQRKVMFVLCDGIPGPCASESTEAHRLYLHDVVKEIRSATPIEIVCIGIGAPEAAEFYNPGYVNVMNAKQLPAICIQQLKRVLLQ